MWDSARHSAHAIWGGAKLLELTEIAELVRVIRDNFHISKALSATRKTQLHEAVEWLLKLADVPNKNFPLWLEQQQTVLHRLLQNLNNAEDAPMSQPCALETDAGADNTPLENQQILPSDCDLAPFDLSHIDGGLLDLFLSEVETHVEVLNEGLLMLENQPNSMQQLEALMRGAHSIKGGARVVGLEPIVGLAHNMEDCFVAAQKQTLQLDSDKIDVLLQACDVLSRIAQAARQQDTQTLAHLLRDTAPLEDHLQALNVGRIKQSVSATPVNVERIKQSVSATPVNVEQIKQSVSATPATAQQLAPATQAQASDDIIYTQPRHTAAPDASSNVGRIKQSVSATPVNVEQIKQSVSATPVNVGRIKQSVSATSSPPQTAEKDRVVRVSANKIERLMGLTGEVTVSARWLPPFSNSMLQLKRSHIDIANLLDKLQDKLSQAEVEPPLLKELLRIREKNKTAANDLNERLNSLDVFTSTLSTHADRLYREMISVRMRPFADGVRGLPRLVRDLSRQLDKKVNFEIVGKTTEVDQDILEKLDAPLNHLIRNALDHGIESPIERRAANKPETGNVRLEAAHRSGLLMITLSDDGRGIDIAKLRDKVKRKGLVSEDLADKLSDAELVEFLFLPGFSTSSQVTEISGRGVGLDVVHSMVKEVGGQVRAESQPGQGLTFHLDLPLTLSVIRTFLVDIAGEPYAFPLARIDRCLQLLPDDIQLLEERQYFRFSDNNIALVNIHDVLELDSSPPPCQEISVVLISDRFNAYGLVVDKFLGEYDLVVRPLDARLGKVADINAVAVMLDGSPVLIFDVEDLAHSIDKLLGTRRLRKIHRPQDAAKTRRKQILVADDSITIRELERKMLEHQGYQVDVAVDGMDAWSALRSDDYDLLVSDIDMPRMDGISLIQRVREHEGLQHLPIVVVSYKDSEEHRLQGMQAGANYYLTKSSFEDDSFVRAIIDLIGEAGSG